MSLVSVSAIVLGPAAALAAGTSPAPLGIVDPTPAVAVAVAPLSATEVVAVDCGQYSGIQMEYCIGTTAATMVR